MKKTIAVLLAVLTALSALAMLSTLNTAAAGTWRSAYKNYINQKSGDAQARFKLVDIDGDDIPELIYYAGTSLGGMSVSTYGGSGIQTVEMGSGGISYVKGKIYCQYGKQGSYYDRVYSVKNGKFTCEFSGYYYANKTNFDFNRPNDFNYSYVYNTTYNENASYSDYKSKLNSCFNTAAGKQIDMWDANVLNAAQAISAVQNYVGRVQITSVYFDSLGIDLAWSEGDGATMYQIARKMTGESSYTYFSTSNDHFRDNSYKMGVSCTYQVRGYNGSKYGPWSSSRSVVTLFKPELTLSNKSNGIRAEWNKMEGATKYVVYYKQTGAASWSSVETTNNYYPFLNLTKGVSYSFQLRVIGKVNGPYSAVKSLVYTPFSAEKPNLTLTNRNDGILASWNKISNATGYIVYYREYNSSNWQSAQTTDTSFLYDTPWVGKAYCFQVQPKFGSVKGSYSAVRTITYAVVSNAKPVVTLSNKSNGIRAEWNAIYGASSYIVYYREYNNKAWASTETKNTYYPFLNAEQGKAYCFQVQPMFGGTRGAYSSVATIVYTTISQEKPVINIENRANSIYLRWKSIPGAYAYIVYYRKDSDKQWQATQTTNLFFNYTKVTKGTRYAFQVQPVFAAGNGAYSAVTRITFTPTYG